MSQVLRLTLPIPVSVNSYLNHRVSGGKGRKFVQTYKTPEAINFEREADKIIKKEMEEQDWIIPEPHKFIKVEAIWHFYKKGIDSNNMHKQMLDTLQNSGVYYNDSMVLESSNNCYINSKNPHCEIKITVMEKEGVFQNREEKLNFCKSNCYLCSKNKTSCSYYKRLLENRIIEEVDLKKNVCSKIRVKKKKGDFQKD